MCSTRNALKVMQLNWSKPNKLETKILRPTLIISICQIRKAIVRNCSISRVENVLAAPRKTKTLTFPIMMKPVLLHSCTSLYLSHSRGNIVVYNKKLIGYRLVSAITLHQSINHRSNKLSSNCQK